MPDSSEVHFLIPVVSLASAVSGVAYFLSFIHLRSTLAGFSILGSLLVLFLGLHIYSLARTARKHRHATTELDRTESEFQSIFENVVDAVFILDDRGICIRANPAAQSLMGWGSERSRLLTKNLVPFRLKDDLHAAIVSQVFVPRSNGGELTLGSDSVRPICLEYSADFDYIRGNHLIILRDITRRKVAEMELSRHLIMTEAAKAEADALRNITLALTQDLSMDYVLDTFLESVLNLIPCESAAVLLSESGTHLFVARHRSTHPVTDMGPCGSEGVLADQNGFFHAVLSEKRIVSVPDATDCINLQPQIGGLPVRSWLGIPLVAHNTSLGLLSLTNSRAHAFTDEHGRVARSLCTAGAVAIQNARLYERASIYGSELEQRLADLDEAQRALRAFNRRPLT